MVNCKSKHGFTKKEVDKTNFFPFKKKRYYHIKRPWDTNQVDLNVSQVLSEFPFGKIGGLHTRY